MPQTPATPILVLGAIQGANGDLPSQDMPALVRIGTTDSVGPDAANRQHKALEKRSSSLYDKVQKLIESHDILNAYFLKRDGTAQDGGTGMTGNLAMNTHRITGLGNPLSAQEAATLAILNDICPVGTIKPWSGTTAPVSATGLVEWMLCEYQSLLIPTLPTDPYYELYVTKWGSTPLYGQADGSHFYLPDGRGRTLIGAGAATGGVGADNTPIGTVRTIGSLVGQEAHSLTGPENGPHTHTYTRTSSVAAAQTFYPFSGNAIAFDSPNTSSSGSGTAHQTTPPSAVIGGWMIRVK